MNVQRSFGTNPLVAGSADDRSSSKKGNAAVNPPGKLYLVATPIGNLEDMTYRAIRILQEVDCVAAEDTRQTRKLFSHYEIHTRLVSYHEHNKRASGPELIRLMLEGQSIALVSDAGLPAICDPGEDLVREAIEEGIAVIPVPGANAALSALIMSGISTDGFTFVGFVPRDRKGLGVFVDTWLQRAETIICYESPHRIIKTLQAFKEKLPQRKLALVRELTKKHEEAVRGTVSECLEWLEQHPPLGEYCLVIAGASAEEQAEQDGGQARWWEELDIASHVAHYQKEVDYKEAMRMAAKDRGVSRREIYNQLNRQG